MPLARQLTVAAISDVQVLTDHNASALAYDLRDTSQRVAEISHSPDRCSAVYDEGHFSSHCYSTHDMSSSAEVTGLVCVSESGTHISAVPTVAPCCSEGTRGCTRKSVVISKH